MKKLSAYIFLAVILVNNLAVTEFGKVHKLFEHYFQHVDRDSKVTVHDFLTMHYFGEDIDDNDQEEDMQLPFKKHEAEISSSSWFSIPVIQVLPQPVFFTAINISSFERSFYLNSNPSSLFRPPQV